MKKLILIGVILVMININTLNNYLPPALNIYMNAIKKILSDDYYNIYNFARIGSLFPVLDEYNEKVDYYSLYKNEFFDNYLQDINDNVRKHLMKGIHLTADFKNYIEKETKASFVDSNLYVLWLDLLFREDMFKINNKSIIVKNSLFNIMVQHGNYENYKNTLILKNSDNSDFQIDYTTGGLYLVERINKEYVLYYDNYTGLSSVSTKMIVNKYNGENF